MLNPQRKELSVSVSDMLEDQDYHLRLCHKDFICVGTGAYTLVSPAVSHEPEHPFKHRTLGISSNGIREPFDT